VRFGRGVLVGSAYFTGRWDECVERADAFLAECEAGSPHYLESDVRQRRAIVRFARGDVAGAEADAARALGLVWEAGDPQLVQHVVSSNIRIAAELGRLDAARELAAELLPTIGVGARLDGLIELAWVAGRVGVADELRELFQGLEPTTSRWLKAGREILDEDFEQAAETFAEIGCVPDEAEARLKAGLRLHTDGQTTAAEQQLEHARAFYLEVAAARYLEQAERPLADSA